MKHRSIQCLSCEVLEKQCTDWLLSESSDLIIQDIHLCGFEWPSIVWVGKKKIEPSQYSQVVPSQDVIMRAVSTLVMVSLMDEKELEELQKFSAFKEDFQKILDEKNIVL